MQYDVSTVTRGHAKYRGVFFIELKVKDTSIMCMCNTFAEFYFRFTELEDELKDGCITLKVSLHFLLFTYAHV